MDKNISMTPSTTEILELRNDKPRISLDGNYIFAATSQNTRKAYQADNRNCALLQLGFFGAFRRSELIDITWESISFVKEGIEILIERSKTDQGGEGQVCAIPFGDGFLCPVTALITWREQSRCESGHVFRHIKKGMVSNESIQPRQVNALIKSIAKVCEIPDAKNYSGHSFRRGFASEASKNNVPFASIKRQGRWRSDSTVMGYIDEGKR